MLGDTNITAIADNTLVTEIEDYSWISQQSGAKGAFTKAACSGQLLAGITNTGEIIYTSDGEVWDKAVLNAESASFYDIMWDGERFLLAGSEGNKGLLVTTTDFSEFTRIELAYDTQYIDGERTKLVDTVLYGIDFSNSIYTVLGITRFSDSSTRNQFLRTFWKGNNINELAPEFEQANFHSCSYMHGKAESNSSYCIFYERYRDDGYGGGAQKVHEAYAFNEAEGRTQVFKLLEKDDINAVLDSVNLFEVRGDIYIQHLTTGKNYNLEKYMGRGTTAVMNTANDFAFVSGVYHNGCLVFFNMHNMLVVRKGESIADKTLEDLVEVTYDGSITWAIKAFDKIYLFGKNGMILASSEEEKSNEALAVSTMSARKALFDANKYTDSQISMVLERLDALTGRVTALEEK